MAAYTGESIDLTLCGNAVSIPPPGAFRPAALAERHSGSDGFVYYRPAGEAGAPPADDDFDGPGAAAAAAAADGGGGGGAAAAAGGGGAMRQGSGRLQRLDSGRLDSAAGLGSGDDRLAVPPAVVRASELRRLHRDMNTQLRTLHEEAEHVDPGAAPNHSASLQRGAAELVDALGTLSKELGEVPDDVWQLAELLGRHESLQAALEDVEARHQQLFRVPGPASEAARDEAELLDEYEALGASFERSFEELHTALREWHAAAVRGMDSPLRRRSAASSGSDRATGDG